MGKLLAGDSFGQELRTIQAPYGLYFGANSGHQPGTWAIDPWGKKLEGAPISAKARSEILKYRELGRLAGQNPRSLDAITMEEYMIQKFGLSQETIRKFLVPGPADGFGLAPTCSPPTPSASVATR